MGFKTFPGARMRNAFPGAVPEIPVSDINKATAYYESSLGFNIDWGDAEGGIAGNLDCVRLFFRSRLGFSSQNYVVLLTPMSNKLLDRSAGSVFFNLSLASTLLIIAAPGQPLGGLHAVCK